MVGLWVVIFVNLGLWRLGVVILWQICRFMGCDSEGLVREWWDLENRRLVSFQVGYDFVFQWIDEFPTRRLVLIL